MLLTLLEKLLGWLIPGSIIRRFIQTRKKQLRNFEKSLSPMPLDVIITSYSIKDAPSILYLGDSSVERISRYDDDKRTTDKMLDMMLGEGSVCGATFTAYSPMIYKDLVKVFTNLPYRPAVVIIPVNMRCFSPTWSLRPAYRYVKEITRLQHFIRTGLLIQREGNIESLKEYKRYMNSELRPNSQIRSVKDYFSVIDIKPADESAYAFRKKNILLGHYINTINNNDIMMNSLLKTAEWLLKNDIKVIIYTTPINRDAIIKFLGDEFINKIVESVEVIRKALETSCDKNGCIFKDLSLSLGKSFFFSDDESTEHLKEEGRCYVARELQAIIKDNCLLDL